MELIRRPKQQAIQLIVENSLTENDIISVSYAKSGKCILAQGSKLVHHVTKVESAKEDRISLIISLTPRNAYQPDLTVFHSMKNLDTNLEKGIPEYEYFRQKAWQCRVSFIAFVLFENHFFKEILDDFCKTVKYENATTDLIEKVGSKNSSKF